MSADHASPGASGPLPGAQHLATLSHQGRFWDVYVELVDDFRSQASGRARLCFSPADRNEGEGAVRTTAILVEPTPEEALGRAREIQEGQLVDLLRSCLPE